MTLQTLISMCNSRRPSSYDKADITSWVNAINKRAIEEVFNKAEDDEHTYEALDPDEDEDLIIPDEFCGAYESYIYAMEDYLNAEFDRYNNDASMYESRFNEFAAYWRRTHMPKEA